MSQFAIHLQVIRLVILAVYICTASALSAQQDSISYFQDCSTCPEMAVIPAGSATLGSHPQEIDRFSAERDLTEVTISSPYAMSKTEVTLAQYRRFMSETQHVSQPQIRDGAPRIGCNYYDGKSYGYIHDHSWQNPGYPQREDAPVVCVSWSDATAYAKWLCQKTGKNYRIPSSVEFEYASRAGSQSTWYWGNKSADACEYANVADRSLSKVYPNRPTFNCDDGYVYTASVAQFKANAYGLYDMIGNAWEWTDDCFRMDLTDAPTNGSAWLEEAEDGDCMMRTPKGGSWISGIGWSRAAVRSRDHAHYKSFMLGFRVAADIE